jgi:hypothetical protein
MAAKRGEAVSRVVNDLAGKLSEAPEKFIGATMAALVVVSFFVLLIGWVAGAEELNVVLLVFGVSSIILLTVLIRQGVALLVAILIIGTVVAPREFLEKIAFFATGSRGDPKELFGEYPREDLVREDPDKIAREITDSILENLNLKALGSPDLVEGLKADVAGLVEDNELVRLADRARVPLKWVVEEDASAFARRARELARNPAFAADMNAMMLAGLIECDNRANLEGCRVTELGGKVYQVKYAAGGKGKR